MAAKKKAAKKTSRAKKVAPASRGLTAAEVQAGASDAALAALTARVEAAGGNVLGRFRDPLGGGPLALAVLPLAQIAPTPFQRDLSATHVKRLATAIEKVGAFLDPVIGVPAPDDDPAAFWTPNGYHRLSALQSLGARSITALLSPDPALAYRILALNTEKAHGTKERSLEAVRMARGLSEIDAARPESDFALELEDASLVTLGVAYEARARFAGGAYAAALKASDGFLDIGIGAALARRSARAERLLAIDDRVSEISDQLRQRGFDSPYLRNFVVARIRPFRPRNKPAPDADALLDHMEQAAAKFDLGKIRSEQIAKSAGAASD
jgi:ParB family chromosome partitioning protein